MKKLTGYFGLLIVLVLAVSCSNAKTSSFFTPSSESTHIIPTAITPTSNIRSEARLSSQCLTVAPTLSGTMTSDGVVVLESRVIENGRVKRESYLQDMTTRETLTLENARTFVISSDRTLMAYHNIMLDSQNQTIKNDLVIADVSGKLLKVIPWNDEWSYMLGWLDNQRLVLSLREDHGVGKPYTLLVLNLFNGEKKLLPPDFPKFLSMPDTKLPYWGGQFGISYDPTLTRVIYPRFIGDDQEMYTYALWDLSEQKLVANLDNIFSAQSIYNDMFPMPHWSPDGSHFVFSGLVRIPDGSSYHVESELYQVSRDGEIIQLTHLYPFASVLDPISWSSNGQYLASFLVTKDTPAQEALITLINTSTLDVINYCIPVYYGGGDIQPPLPIWSPDGKQFLISDRYEEDHWRVILVDIEKGNAAQIATDMEAVGWMTKEP